MKFFFLFCSMILATAVQSRELSDLERSDLEARLDRLSSAFLDSDFEIIVELLPPKLFEYLAVQNGLNAEDIADASVDQMQALSSSFTIHKIASSTAKTDIVEVTMVGFTKILYGAAGIKFTATIDDQRVSFDTQVLAILDNDEWYLMRVDSDKQLDILKEIYPFLTDYEVRPARIRPADN